MNERSIPREPAVQPATATSIQPGWPELGVAVVAALVLYLGGALLVDVVAPPRDPIVNGLVQFAFSGLAPLCAAALAVLVRIRDVRAFGVRSVRPWWLLVAVGVGLFCVAFNSVLDAIVPMLFPSAADVQADYRTASAAGLLPFLGTIALGGILTPIGEEALFRGVLASVLLRWGPWVTVSISGLVFAASHGINLVFPDALVVGLLAAYLFYRTRSIWPGIVVHIVYNSTFLILYAIGLV